MLEFLKENTEKNEDLGEILERYEQNGYLDEYEYNEFIQLKLKLLKKDVRENNSINDIEVLKSYTRNSEGTIFRVPYPHCSFLCSHLAKFCSKCGEPLPKIDIKNKTYKIQPTQIKRLEGSKDEPIEQEWLNKLKEFLNSKILTRNLQIKRSYIFLNM